MNKTKIIIGFDFGLKNIGVAVGQQITYTAQPITTLKAKIGTPNWSDIKKIFDEWRPKILVVGLPININGEHQPLTNLTYQFSIKLQTKYNLHVILHDEQFSTKEARSNLFENQGYRALEPNQINSISAVIILESWLQQTYYKKIKTL